MLSRLELEVPGHFPELDGGTIDRSPLIFQTLLHCQQWKTPWVSHENQPIETPDILPEARMALFQIGSFQNIFCIVVSRLS